MSKPSTRAQRASRLQSDIAEVEHSISRCSASLQARLMELDALGIPEVAPFTKATDRTVARYRQLLKQYQQRLAHLKKKERQG